MREKMEKVAQDILGGGLDLSTLNEEDVNIVERDFPEFLGLIDEAENNIDQARSYYELLEILYKISGPYDELLNDVHNKLVSLINKLPITG